MPTTATTVRRGWGEEELCFLEDWLDGKLDDGDITNERLHRIVADRPIKPWNILAITFTNKAAGELKERLEAMLGEQALDIQASTFHSACMRILRREIGALGYESSFTVYDTDDSVRIIKEALKELSIQEKVMAPQGHPCLHQCGKGQDDDPAGSVAGSGRRLPSGGGCQGVRLLPEAPEGSQRAGL